MWVKLSSVILRYRIIIAIIVALFTMGMAYLATQVGMSQELVKVIPDDDPANIVYEKFKNTFGEDGSVVVIGVQSDQLFQLEFIKAWYKLTESIDSLENVKQIISLTKLYDVRKNDSTMSYQVVPLLKQEPQSQAEIDTFLSQINRLPFYANYLYNLDSNSTFIAVTMDDYGVNSHRRIEIVEEIERLGHEVSEQLNVELYYSGVPYIRTVNTRKLSKELALFTFLSVIITGLFLLLFFRSLQIVATSLILVIISLIFTMGSMYIMGYKIGILTALIPPLIVVIAIQNCIYLLNIYHFEYKAHGNKMLGLSRTIRKVGLASFLTNATTAIGFGAFAFTGSSLLDEFGRLAAVNIMTVYVLCIVLIPIIYSYLPGPTSKQLKHLDRRTLGGLLRFVNFVVFNKRRWVYTVTILVLIVSIWGATKVRTFGYILDGISPKEKLYTDLKFFERNFNGLFPFEIYIDTKEPGAVRDLATLTRIEKLNKELSTYHELSKPIAVTEILKFMNQAYYDGNPRRYLLPNPLEIGKIMAYMPQDMNKKEGSILSSVIDSNFQVTRVSMKISDVGTIRSEEITQEVQNKLDSIFPGEQYEAHVTGKSVITVMGNRYLIKNAIIGLGYAFIIIGILMGLLFNSFKMISIALLPNLIPLFLTLGIMGFSGISLKESTILIFSVAFGIVIDLTIHYIAKYRIELKRYNWNITKAVEASINQSGFSMIYTTVILFFGFIIFVFSSFEGTFYLGLLTSLCLALGLITNLFLLPSLLLGMEKRMNMKKAMRQSLLNMEDDE